jgi:hypothetical protein
MPPNSAICIFTEKKPKAPVLISWIASPARSG